MALKSDKLISVILIIMSAIIVVGTLVLREENSVNPALKNIMYSKKSLLKLPTTFQITSNKNTLLVIVLEDLSCAVCLNEVVGMIDTVEHDFIKT